MVRTRLRQLLTGAVMEKSFRSSEKFEEPDIELAPASFLYSDTHGFHYVQGAYLKKGFEKHGQLSNPYAYGYFPEMTHQKMVCVTAFSAPAWKKSAETASRTPDTQYVNMIIFRRPTVSNRCPIVSGPTWNAMAPGDRNIPWSIHGRSALTPPLCAC